MNARSPRVGLYSDAPVIGGAERSMFNLVAAYRGTCELSIVSPSLAIVAEAERLVPDTPRHLVRARGHAALALVDHRRALRALGLDLLQVTLANPFASRPALIGGWAAGIPTIAVEQLVLPSKRRRGALAKRLVSRLHRAHVAVGTRSAADLHRFFGIPAAAITVIHNGVPDRVVEPIRHAPPPVIGAAARLEDQKHLELLVDALASIPGAHLVLVGDGSRRADLERRAADQGIGERVRFLGWCDDALPHIAGFDVFALPSRAESFPLSIVEAMLAGVPVVASDVGSVADAVVDGLTGILVPPGDAAALERGLVTVLSDPELAIRLADRARDRARSLYTDVAMADAYDRLWTATLQRRSGRGGATATVADGRR